MMDGKLQATGVKRHITAVHVEVADSNVAINIDRRIHGNSRGCFWSAAWRPHHRSFPRIATDCNWLSSSADFVVDTHDFRICPCPDIERVASSETPYCIRDGPF